MFEPSKSSIEPSSKTWMAGNVPQVGEMSMDPATVKPAPGVTWASAQGTRAAPRRAVVVSR